MIYIDPSKTTQRYYPIMVYANNSILSCINNITDLKPPDNCDYVTYYSTNIKIKFKINYGPLLQIIDKDNNTEYILVLEDDYDGEYIQAYIRKDGKESKGVQFPIVDDYFVINKKADKVYI